MQILISAFGFLIFPWTESPVAILIGILSAVGIGFAVRNWGVSLFLKSISAGAAGTKIYLVIWIGWQYFFNRDPKVGWSVVAVPLMLAVYTPIMTAFVWAMLRWPLAR